MMRLFRKKVKKNEYAIHIKHIEGDKVWVLHTKQCTPVQREVKGVRVQIIKGKKKILYSFLKDGIDNHGGYYDYNQTERIREEDKYFWVYEHFCYETSDELLNEIK